MAKKKTAKKKTTTKTTKPTTSAAGKKSSSAPKSTKKAAKKTTKKTTKKVVKKSTASKTTKKTTPKVVKKSSKKVAKKTTKKTAKKSAKKTAKKTTAKSKVVKKTTTKKKVVKKAPVKTSKKTPAKPAGKKTTKKVSAASKATKSDAPASEEAKPATPQGETKASEGSSSSKRRRPSKVKKPLVLPDRPLLLGPNGPSLKPLIPSGTKVKKKKSVLDNVTSRRTKTPLTKSQLEHYRHILLVKRLELLGDVKHLEDEALRSDSGSSSASIHPDEQGSESYEQSLNLNLAASDRELIHEIDDALKRITERTYGLCEITHEPIKKARLDELPWARHTIHAARELDQRGGKL